MLPLKISLKEVFLNNKIIVKKKRIMQVEAKENNIGFEFLTAILSMFEVILQINATISINLGPSSLTMLRRGSIGLCTLLLKFKI